MIIVPFIFFLTLTLYWWREHKGIDVCVYISSLYALTTFLAIIIIIADITEGTNGEDSGGMLWGNWEPVLGILPTFTFCTLLGLSIYPFSQIYTRDIQTISNKAPWSLLALSALLILVGLVTLYCVADSTLDILSGDLSFVREGAYKGDQTPAEIKASKLPFPLGHLTYFQFASILAMPIAFYNMCFTNRPWWWNALLMFSSMSSIMAGIQRVDRTEPIFFTLMFIFCIVFFRKFFSKKVKYTILGVSALFVIVGITYITVVSMARFNDRKSGNAVTSIVQYAGQGYLNYCYFWEHASTPTIETEREFPLFNHYVRKVDSDDIKRGERSAKEGFFISVFATFIGDVLLDLGPVLMPLWVFGYVLLCLFVIKHKRRRSFDVSEVLLLFFLASIPLFGIFYYRYFAWMIALTYVLVFLFWIASNFKLVYEDTDNNSNIQCDAVDTSLPDKSSGE